MKVYTNAERFREERVARGIRETTKQTLTEAKVLKALRAVQKKLKTGEISGAHFNMDTCADKDTCGTVGCIGGWLGLEFIGVKRIGLRHTIAASHLMDDAIDVVKNSDGLYNLFYNYYHPSENRTPAGAAKAITAFFKGERHPWQAVDAKAAR